ncbi:hypothetical protein ABTQ33_04845 [Paucilactobacillus suebicus]|uniref:Transcriptional regulator n=1 Tax=Paucilactobacillus suebicus DSM 5007 = KCTC 3549 TaxID=1423807 RepID=A0A0R1W337_9LACO|nr:hypothetical protein [Paucilactobacillus suebicus]KRM12272.1 transcriptional regulator [Paucilactobacillus suebicus DSM 5007 = KCTC 3549]
MTQRILSKEKIVKQAVNLINSGQSATFTSIGKSLGSKSQAIYPYFKNPTALDNAIFAYSTHQLVENVQSELFGVPANQIIMAFAKYCRKYGLKNVNLLRYLLSFSENQRNSDDAHAATLELDALYEKIFTNVSDDPQTTLVIKRTVRNLIVGDIIHVGAGWFHNPIIDSDESFEVMIQNLLNK